MHKMAPYITLAIDPGLRNVGWAMFEDRKLTDFGVYDLHSNTTREQRTKYPDLVMRFIEKSPDLFNRAHAVVIEMQMHARMKIIQTSFQCFCWGKSILVPPRLMRTHHGISMGDYKANKRASVSRAPKYMNTQQKKVFVELTKRDDIADAVMLAAYHVDKHFQEIARKEAEEKIANLIMVAPENKSETHVEGENKRSRDEYESIVVVPEMPSSNV